MSLRVSESYRHVIDKARWSHAHGRSISHIDQNDIDSARLFSYAYRSQVIGTFHATRVALKEEGNGATLPRVNSCLDQACTILKQLEDKAIDLVPRDYRAVISTLYYYDYWVNAAIEILNEACAPKMHSGIRLCHGFHLPISADVGYAKCCSRLEKEKRTL